MLLKVVPYQDNDHGGTMKDRSFLMSSTSPSSSRTNPNLSKPNQQIKFIRDSGISAENSDHSSQSEFKLFEDCTEELIESKSFEDESEHLDNTST